MHIRERGTASMEAVMCLPFLVLLLALVLNLAYAFLNRLRLEGAARLASEEYVMTQDAAGAESTAQAAYATLSGFGVSFTQGGDVAIDSGILGLFGSLSREAGLVQLQGSAALQPPFTSLQSPGSAAVTMTWSRNTWTVSDLGSDLTLGVILKPMPRIIDKVLGGLMSLLGMQP
jgi:hypothetical protein